MFTNRLDWLVKQVRVSAFHAEYARDGRLIASVTLSGEPHLVRELMDRFAELSEAGQSQRTHAKEEV